MSLNNITYPLTIHHSDSPDFLVEEGEDSFGIEFTEANNPEFYQEYIKEKSPHISEFTEVPIDCNAVNIVIDDIKKAIGRKEKKNYAGQSTDLIIYPNSSHRMAVGLGGNKQNKWNEKVLSAEYDVSAFRNVYIFWSEDPLTFEKI